jgi:putative iron-dependent peroxidase
VSSPNPSDTPVRIQEPQAVLSALTASAIFLVATVERGGEGAVRDLLGDLSGLVRTVGFRVSDAGLTLVTGIGSDAWDRLFAGPRPDELHPFVELRGDRHHAVSTPGDLLFHIRAAQPDVCFELATLIVDRLAGAATVVDEVHGFKYFDDRDLLGFVDGTENPIGTAATSAAIVGDDDPDFAGSSYVIVQKYLHDMSAWNAMTVEEQELAVGRRKLSNVELDDDVKPDDSHVALNTITDPDGTERQIVRDNMAFGHVGRQEFGTYFIGYAARPGIIEQMLRNMFIGDPPGNTDRLLEVSKPVTGGLFFVPPADLLEDLPAGPTDAT